ncbi:hypothetical protein KI387_009986, partial [Taxus chinensis]
MRDIGAQIGRKAARQSAGQRNIWAVGTHGTRKAGLTEKENFRTKHSRHLGREDANRLNR